VSTGLVLIELTSGAALLALWAYIRWPSVAPATLGRAVLRLLLALLVLQVGLHALRAGAEVSSDVFSAAAIVVATVVPALTYAFLASLWFMKLCADQMRGAL
jgi:hypothetical protein